MLEQDNREGIYIDMSLTESIDFSALVNITAKEVHENGTISPDLLPDLGSLINFDELGDWNE